MGVKLEPPQNAFIERYNRTIRYWLLNQYLFKNFEVIQNSLNRWLWFYNHERPPSGRHIISRCILNFFRICYYSYFKANDAKVVLIPSATYILSGLMIPLLLNYF